MTLPQQPISSPRFDLRSLLDRLLPFAALLILLVAATLCDRTFIKPENLLNVLRQNSFIGIVALAMTFVIISGGIDLSVGSLVALSAVAGVWIMNTAIESSSILSAANSAQQSHMPAADSALRIAVAKILSSLHLADRESVAIFLAAATMLLISLIGGLLNSLLIAKARLAPFIATLATMAIFRSAALTLADAAELRSASPDLFQRLGRSGIPLFGIQIARNLPLELPYPVIAFVLLAFFSAILLSRTRYGRYVYALGCNERSAIYSAVNVNRIKWITYTLCGFFCGIAALFLSSRLNSVSSSGAGQYYELDAIAAVVIGGTRIQGGSGSILGTVIGVLILGVIGNMLTILNVSPYLQGMVKGFIIIAAVLLQRSGRGE